MVLYLGKYLHFPSTTQVWFRFSETHLSKISHTKCLSNHFPTEICMCKCQVFHSYSYPLKELKGQLNWFTQHWHSFWSNYIFFPEILSPLLRTKPELHAWNRIYSWMRKMVSILVSSSLFSRHNFTRLQIETWNQRYLHPIRAWIWKEENSNMRIRVLFHSQEWLAYWSLMNWVF